MTLFSRPVDRYDYGKGTVGGLSNSPPSSGLCLTFSFIYVFIQNEILLVKPLGALGGGKNEPAIRPLP